MFQRCYPRSMFEHFRRDLLRDWSVSALVAGLVVVLVGYTSSVVIVFAAAQALGATAAQTTSWMWALGIGMGVTCIGLSVWYRKPVVTAWSTPGAALIASTQGLSMPEAVGAFVVCAVLVIAVGATGWFERAMSRLPLALAAALLAGVLSRFALDAALAAHSAPLLVVVMALAFVVGRRWWPRYAVPVVLVVGMALAGAQGRLQWSAVQISMAEPVWTTPVFTLPAVIGLALPLFVVTMASQYLPGVAAQRAAGYDTPVSPAVTATGATTLVLAPFGGYSVALAAITAAICMGREAHEDPAKRWVAAVAAGMFYIAVGLAGGAVVGVLNALPRELVLALAGLALVGTIAGALAVAMKSETQRDAALITFVVTLSGVTLAGIGAAFWGVVAGGAALLIQRWNSQSTS
jgi:benzoate membrane transport protein